MQYKTIVHELLLARTELHEQLRLTRRLKPTLETCARELKASHEAWKERLSQEKPESDPSQVASEALEMCRCRSSSGSFALRAGRRQRTAFARSGDGLSQNSYVARLKASRGQPSLFDAPPAKPASVDGSPAAPVPPGAKSDGTLISPPGRASGIPVPPEGLPQNSAGSVAARAEPRPGADSPAYRQAPLPGPVTPGEGDPTMTGAQFSLQLEEPPPRRFNTPQKTPSSKSPADQFAPAATIAGGEKTKARDIVAAIRTLKVIEQEQRLATPEEKQVLARFAGFGPVALSIFPDPVKGTYNRMPDGSRSGEELKTLAEHRTNTTAATARRSTPSIRRQPSSPPSTRRSNASACLRAPPYWSQVAAPATS